VKTWVIVGVIGMFSQCSLHCGASAVKRGLFPQHLPFTSTAAASALAASSISISRNALFMELFSLPVFSADHVFEVERRDPATPST